MSTVLDILTGARLLCRDPDGNDLTDELGIGFINNHLKLIHQTLINVQSDLIRARTQITTEDGTAEYTLGGDSPILATGIMPAGIWKDGFPGNPLERKIKSEWIAAGYDLSDEAEPHGWYPVLPNKIGFVLTPNDAYTYNVNYWIACDVFETDDLEETVSYSGIFDQALIYWLAMDYNMSIEKDASMIATQLSTAYKTAMQYVYEYGTSKLAASSDMFSVDGV